MDALPDFVGRYVKILGNYLLFIIIILIIYLFIFYYYLLSPFFGGEFSKDCVCTFSSSDQLASSLAGPSPHGLLGLLMTVVAAATAFAATNLDDIGPGSC